MHVKSITMHTRTYMNSIACMASKELNSMSELLNTSQIFKWGSQKWPHKVSCTNLFIPASHSTLKKIIRSALHFCARFTPVHSSGVKRAQEYLKSDLHSVEFSDKLLVEFMTL